MSETGPLDDELAAGIEAVFAHLNENHADSVRFLAGHLTGSLVGDSSAGNRLVDAELAGADAQGVEVRVRDAGSAWIHRFEFPTPIETTADLQGHLIGALGEARTAHPDAPMTSIEAELAGQDDIPTRVVTVSAVRNVAPGIRELRFAGMTGHRPLGGDDFFLVIRPRPQMEHLLDERATFAVYRDLPADEAPDWAYYSCRRWHAETEELDAWFVLHEHDGPISGWARRAAVGDRVALWGPRQSYLPPEDTTSVLLVGDETALGAFAAIVERTEPTVAIRVVLESDDGEPTLGLPDQPATTIEWVSRRGAERGTGTALLDRVRDLDDLDVSGLYAYGAGESRIVTAIRNHLRHDRAMPGHRVQMVGYWRRSDV